MMIPYIFILHLFKSASTDVTQDLTLKQLQCSSSSKGHTGSEDIKVWIRRQGNALKQPESARDECQEWRYTERVTKEDFVEFIGDVEQFAVTILGIESGCQNFGQDRFEFRHIEVWW